MVCNTCNLDIREGQEKAQEKRKTKQDNKIEKEDDENNDYKITFLSLFYHHFLLL